MAESPLFNSFVNNLPNQLFNQKKSTPQPYYDDEYLAEQEGLRKHYDEGGAGPTSPDPDQTHYEEIQFDRWLNLDTVADIESNNTGDARSESGALGYFQIIPDVARNPGYGITPLVTPEGTYTEEDILSSSRISQKNFARSYFTQARAIFKDSKAKTLIAYNMGIGAAKDVDKGKRNLSPEGIGYLHKHMLAGAINKQEILKAYPKLKDNIWTNPEGKKVKRFGNMIREDGTTKSETGFLGPIKNNIDGKTMTEVSFNFDDVLDGALIPLLVPTLTDEDINVIKNLNIRKGPIPRSILDKAIKHAKERDAQGLSPFYSDDEGRKK